MPEHKMIVVGGVRYRPEDAPQDRGGSSAPVAPKVEPEAAAPSTRSSGRSSTAKRKSGGSDAGNG